MPKLRGILLITALVLTVAPVFAENTAKRCRGPMMTSRLGALLREEEPRIKERAERIKRELAELDRNQLDDSDWARDWAGWYYEGDGLGTNVSVHLAPENGISFLNYGCMGLYGGDHGEIIGVEPDGLRLRLVFGTPNNSFLSERVYFVRWGGYQYLVADWQMMTIVNHYNNRTLNGFSWYGIPRKMENDVHPLDIIIPNREDLKPQLPVEFQEMLFDKPVALKVVSVSDYHVEDLEDNRKRESCTVVFDRGLDANIHEGMEFTLRPMKEPKGYGRYLITFSDNGIATADFEVSSWVKADTYIPERGDTLFAGPQLAEPYEPEIEGPRLLEPENSTR